MTGEIGKFLAAFLGGSVVSYILQIIIGYFSRPRLELAIKGNAGLLVETPGSWVSQGNPPIPEEFIYVRALVRNSGRQSARQCIAYLEKIIWIDQSGKEHVFSDKDLIEMKWSWRGHGIVDIPREAYQYIDLFQIWKSNLGSSFCSDRFPSYLQKWGSGGGKIYFFIKVCCDNARPATQYLQLSWDGSWGGAKVVE